MTDRIPDITRDKIEHLLHETFGFQGDQAVMDAIMLTIDAYAVALAYDLAGSPVMVREGYVHLLMQQAELLLDSGGRLALTGELASQVLSLSGIVAAIDAARMDFTVKALAQLDETFADARAQVSEQNAGAPAGLIPGDMAAILAQEAEVAEAVAEREDLLSRQDMLVLADWEASLAGTQECIICHKPKPLTADYWWRNSTSPTGFEKRCAECRRAEKVARRAREKAERAA